MKTDEYVTVGAAAMLLGTSVNTPRLLAKLGKIPFKRRTVRGIPGVYLFPVKAIIAERDRRKLRPEKRGRRPSTQAQAVAAMLAQVRPS